MVHDAAGPQVRGLDFRNGITASIDQIRGQNVRAGENIVERTRLGRRVQGEYAHAIRYSHARRGVISVIRQHDVVQHDV